VPEAGFEPAHSFERHPLKMVCLPNSTTPARTLTLLGLRQATPQEPLGIQSRTLRPLALRSWTPPVQPQANRPFR
jgi:hypothetical protein